MIWIIFYTNINNFLVLGDGITATLDFYPAASVFQCMQAASLIINLASHVFYYFHVSCLSDDSWTLFGQTTAEVFLFLSPCEGAMASLFCLQNPMHAQGCVPQTTCEVWPLSASEQKREGASEESPRTHRARVCSLLHGLHWLHSEHQTSLHSTWTSGWLLTHSNYLSGIPKCLTVQPAQSRRAAASQTSHTKLPIPFFPISAPTWMKLFNITLKQSIGKKGWKRWFLFIRKTTTWGEKVDFSFKSSCMKGNSVNGEHHCHRKLMVTQDFNPGFTFKILQVWKSLSLCLTPSTSGLTPWITI